MSIVEMIVRKVEGWAVVFGGEIHSGWLPLYAATPLPTPIEREVLDVTIEKLEGGYLLIWAAQPSETCRELLPPKVGDSWHAAIEDADAAAEEWFGIKKTDWDMYVQGAS